MNYFTNNYQFKVSKEQMWKAYRDHLVEIGNHISFVQQIEVISREEKNDETLVTNIWDTSGQIPGGIKNFLPESLFKYTDVAKWDNKNYLLHFEDFPSGGSNIYKINGKAQFEGDQNETQITQNIEIELNILDNLPALKKLPSFMRQKIIEQINKYFMSEAKKNLKTIINEVYRYTLSSSL